MSDDERGYAKRYGSSRRLSQEEAKRNSRSIFVGGIPYDWDEKDLDDCFGRYGRLERITVTFDRHTGKNRGFAFVTYAHRRDAEDAYDEYNGHVVDGRRLRLDWDPGLEYKRGSNYNAQGQGRMSRDDMGDRRRPPPRHYSRRSYSRSRSRTRSPPRARTHRSRSRSRDRSWSRPNDNYRCSPPRSEDRGRSPRRSPSPRRSVSLGRGRADRDPSPSQGLSPAVDRERSRDIKSAERDEGPMLEGRKGSMSPSPPPAPQSPATHSPATHSPATHSPATLDNEDDV